MSEVITSVGNTTVKRVRELHRTKARRARRETIIEGPTVFGEFLDAGIVPTVVLATPNDSVTIQRCAGLGIEPVLVSDDVLVSASDTRSPRSPVAVISIPSAAGLRSHNTLVLVDIADPGNVGTMIRTAAGLGWDVAVSGTTAELWSPKTIRSSAGTHIRTRLIQISAPVEEAETAGLTTVATVVAGGVQPQPLQGPVALLIGSEAHGLRAEIVERCAIETTIGMPGGTESLNAAVAASIAMYAMTVAERS